MTRSIVACATATTLSCSKSISRKSLRLLFRSLVNSHIQAIPSLAFTDANVRWTAITRVRTNSLTLVGVLQDGTEKYGIPLSWNLCTGIR
jgi:hypothetical protein